MLCGDQHRIGERDQPPTPQRKPVHHGGAGVGVDSDDELHYHARDTYHGDTKVAIFKKK